MKINELLKPKLTHKERVLKTKDFISKNKVFTAVTAVLLCAMLFIFVANKLGANEKIQQNIQSKSQITQAEKEQKNLKWNFNFSDFYVLTALGGFCLIMIFREKKKLKTEV